MFELFKRWDDPVESQIETLTIKPRAARGTYRKRKKAQTSKEESLQMLLTYICDNNGKYMTGQRMARALKVSEGYIWVLMAELAKAGAVRREGKKGHYKYTALRRKVSKQVRAPRKGRPSTQETPEERKILKTAGKKIENRRVFFSNENMTKIISVLRKTEGEIVSIEEIAEMAGLSRSTAHNYIRLLKDRGELMQSRNIRGKGHQYRVKQEVKIDTTPKHVPEVKVNYGKTMYDVREAEDIAMLHEFLKFYRSRKG